jgi:hypothetical protein
MMNCPDLPALVRRGLQNTRKIHSTQCSSLPFGSQRRYFTKLYARLREVPVEEQRQHRPHDDVVVTTHDVSPTATVVKNDECYNVALQTNCFLFRTGYHGGGEVRNKWGSTTDDYWQCQKCRMVPFDYRAPGSLYFGRRPTIEAMKQHSETCQQDGIFWDSIQQAMKELDEKYCSTGGPTKLIHNESFKNTLRTILGNSDSNVFTACMEMLEDSTKSSPSHHHGRDLWRQLPTTVDFRDLERAFLRLANELKLASSNLNDHPCIVRFLQQLSCNLQVPVPNITQGEDVTTSTTTTTTILLDTSKGGPDITMRQQASTSKAHPIVGDKLLDNLKVVDLLEGTIKQDGETVSLKNEGAEQQKSDSTTELDDLISCVNDRTQLPVRDLPFESIATSSGNVSLGTNLLIATACQTNQEEERRELDGYAFRTLGESLFSNVPTATNEFDNFGSSKTINGTTNKPTVAVDSKIFTDDKSLDDPACQFEDP